MSAGFGDGKRGSVGDDNGFTGDRGGCCCCDGTWCLVNNTLDFNVADIVVNGRTVVVCVVAVVVLIAVIFSAVGFEPIFGLNIGLNDSAHTICNNPADAI